MSTFQSEAAIGETRETTPTKNEHVDFPLLYFSLLQEIFCVRRTDLGTSLLPVPPSLINGGIVKA